MIYITETTIIPFNSIFLTAACIHNYVVLPPESLYGIAQGHREISN